MEKVEVIFKEVARISIRDIALYIQIKGYPDTAEKFVDRLYKFGYSLATFPDEFPVCRHEKYAKRHLRYAVFEHNYVFIYKTVGSRLVFYNIVHSCRIH